ncbi:MAG TPA: VOC family protein [Longimicrobium sp.]|uniref:VOC family protein n=1 Tax=Longimicrobium sp. TaxID=2029185 RepID=UPI002EDA24B1
MKKLTPVLVVDAIEPCLPFWVDRLGFTRTIEVPEDDRLGFVALEKDGVEVMVQTRSSAVASAPGMEEFPFGGPTHLYIEVSDFDAVDRALEGAEVIVPRRTTSYGATEIVVREPCGHFIGFASMASAAE